MVNTHTDARNHRERRRRRTPHCHSDRKFRAVATASEALPRGRPAVEHRRAPLPTNRRGAGGAAPTPPTAHWAAKVHSPDAAGQAAAFEQSCCAVPLLSFQKSPVGWRRNSEPRQRGAGVQCTGVQSKSEGTKQRALKEMKEERRKEMELSSWKRLTRERRRDRTIAGNVSRMYPTVAP